MNSEPKTNRGWRITRRLLIGLAVLATVVAIFYTEEDWRGKRAWEKQKHEIEAKGIVLDWNKYIPSPVPDDQNFFTASTNIAIRFVKAQTDTQGEAATQLQWLRIMLPESRSIVVAEVTIISPKSTAVPDGADLYLCYDHSVLTIGKSANASEPQLPVEPMIKMEEIPLKIAIEALAKEAKLNCAIDSKVKSEDSKGNPILISVRWEKVTAREALLALLDNYGLVLIENAKDGTARVEPKTGRIYADPDVREQINQVLSHVIEQSTNGLPGSGLMGAQGVWLFANSQHPVKPAHIVILANRIRDTNVISEICSGNTVKSTGTNSFNVYGAPRWLSMSAEDYLKWSDQYEPAFDEIREALKRPYAIIPGNYSRPYLIPIPNFITLRALAQTLAQRAQCDFLLNKPDEALREVTLMHDVCKILEKPPTGAPMTLVEAMIHVAIMGLYVNTVSDGMRMNAWREPQLAALQSQLQATDLLPSVTDAFRFEQIATAHTFETMSSSEIVGLFSVSSTSSDKKKKFGDRFRRFENPLYLMLKFGPRGWIYQNMVVGSGLMQKQLDCIDLSNRVMASHGIKSAFDETDKILGHWSPYNFMVAVGMPNFLKAWQTTAHNQMLVDEAQVACALERYRLAHGDYPETLDALAPQFIETLPHDIIGGGSLHYQRTAQGKFLLYSIGWNEKDDGGVDSSEIKNASLQYAEGDWVWKN